jgi:hypothetical protein
MTTPKKPRARKVAPPTPAKQPPPAVEQEPAKVELPPIRRIDLDPAEAAELRALHANRVLVGFQAASIKHMADGLVAVADQQIRDCAHRMAKTAGVDLSQESGGRWHIDAERGCIEEILPDPPPQAPAPADAKEP